MAREIKADTQELLNDTSAIKEDTAQILAEIARLQEQLPGDAQRNHASGFMLERYLENLTSYAETVYDTLSDNIDERRGSENGSIKRQRSTSPTTRPSSNAGEARITENNHAAQPIAPRSPEDREGKIEAPEEYLIPEQKAADLARETTAQGILRRFSKRRRRQHADDHDNEDQSRFSGPPEIATEAEPRPKLNHDHARRTISVEYVPQHVEQPRAQAALINTNPSGIKSPRELMRERAAREASRDYTGGSKSVSDMSGSDSKIDGHYLLPLHSHSPPTTVTQDLTLTSPPVPLKVDQQKRQVSETAVARKPTIAAHIAEANSLHFDPQKQTDDVSQTENLYRRPPRDTVGVGNLSPGANQNQTDGNTPPQLRLSPAYLKAKSRKHAPRKSVLGRRARTEALREANDSREGEVDDSDDSCESRSPPKSSTDTKPASHVLQRARTEALRKANESRGGDSYYTDSDNSYDSRSPPERSTDTKPASLKSLFDFYTISTKPVHAICADIIRVLNQLKVEYTEIRGGFRCRYVLSIDRPVDIPAAELGGSLILEFEVLVLKVPLLPMHGIHFKRRSGAAWQYKNKQEEILRKLRL
jgi:hypothetical protein